MRGDRSEVDNHQFNIYSANLELWKTRIWQMKYQ